jgi:hypothetical protein
MARYLYYVFNFKVNSTTDRKKKKEKIQMSFNEKIQQLRRSW